MPKKSRTLPQPSHEDEIAWATLANPKGGKLTETQFKQVLGCTTADITTLKTQVKTWAQAQHDDGNMNHVHALNHGGDTKQWSRLKEDLGQWLAHHDYWGTYDRFGPIRSTESEATVVINALGHAIRYAANISIERPKAKGRRSDNVARKEEETSWSLLSSTHQATPSVTSAPVENRRLITDLRRYSVILVNPLEKNDITRFPFQSVTREEQEGGGADPVWAENISWERFLRLANRAACKKSLPTFSTLHVAGSVIKIVDENSLEVILGQYMDGKHQDDMGNFVVHPSYAIPIN